MANIASPEKIAQRRAEILEAAISVFARKGFHASAIADIAKELGIGHGTIYRYYKNKRDLFDAILNSLLQQLAAMVTEEPPTTNSLEEYRLQLQRIGDSLIGIFYKDPRLAKITFYDSLGVDPEIAQSINGIIDLFANFTEHYLENGLKKGFLRKNMNTKIASRLITAMIFEQVKSVSIQQPTEADIALWREEIIRFMIGGMGHKE